MIGVLQVLGYYAVCIIILGTIGNIIFVTSIVCLDFGKKI